MAVTGFSNFGGRSYQVFNPDAPNLLESDVIKAIAQKHGRSTAQILLRFAVQKNVAVIPKSSSEERLKQNLDVFSFSLDEDDLTKIHTLEAGVRFNDPGEFAQIPIFA
jgi:diketogulonate reductase-like aldo/keto reductase